MDQGQALARGLPRKEVVELNNGRLAMLACIGLWAQELVQHGQPVMFTLLEKVATYEIPALFQNSTGVRFSPAQGACVGARASPPRVLCNSKCAKVPRVGPFCDL